MFQQILVIGFGLSMGFFWQTEKYRMPTLSLTGRPETLFSTFIWKEELLNSNFTPLHQSRKTVLNQYMATFFPQKPKWRREKKEKEEENSSYFHWKRRQEQKVDDINARLFNICSVFTAQIGTFTCYHQALSAGWTLFSLEHAVLSTGHVYDVNVVVAG